MFSLTMILSGCGSKKVEQPETTTGAQNTTQGATTQATTQEQKLDPVNLVYYFGGGQQADLEAVNQEINKYLTEKINATIKLNLVDWSGYDQKMKVIISAGEPYDLCFTATWMNNYFQNVAKGAFLPIDDLLTKYAPGTKAGVPEKIWAAARVNGKIYGVINYQIMATGYGISVRRDFAEKYAFDWKSVTKYEDLEPYLAATKKGEPDKVPLEYSNTSDPFTGAAPLYGLDVIGDQKVPGWVYLNDSSLKVVNQYDTPEFKNLINTMRKWYQAGYLKKDAYTIKDVTEDRKVAKYSALFPSYIAWDNVDVPTGNGNLFTQTGVKWNDKRVTLPIVTTDRAAATITAISKSSANPERAMMFLELVNTDAKLFNTFCYGVEGKHYNKISDTRVETVENSGYSPNTSWEFGNNINLLLDQTQSEDKFTELWTNLNSTAQASPLLGFTFDSEPVKAEIAQCQSVIDEYLASLTSGSVDPVKFQAELIDKLAKAGADKVIAEKQKQIDSWVASNK
jgi:ABC-type sugar transport system, periplasmic component